MTEGISAGKRIVPSRLRSLFFVLLFLLLSGFLIFASTAASARAGLAPDASVELHAHLFMKQGMTWGFRGDFFGPLAARSWRDRFSSQADPDALARSGLGIVVAALYAHPLFTYTEGESLRDSIRAQIQLARKFVLGRPDWMIATEPGQAREALAAGKHVMILALEGASGIIENERDLREFVDEGGIRIVGPLHLTDDEFGGVAFLRGWRVLSDPLAWLLSLGPLGSARNRNGLTDSGRTLIRSLLDRHVWIDLAHASDRSASEMIPMILQAGQPLLYTHTVLREYHRAERGATKDVLQRIARSGGIVGLMPSEDMLAGAPVSPTCRSALYGLSREYEEVASIFAAAGQGSESVMMGSDYNGGIEHLRPAGPKCGTGTSLDSQGLWNMGQIPALWKSLRTLGAPVPRPLSKMVQKFVSDWQKVRPD